MRLSTKIFIGLFFGIATGLFLGEYAEPFRYIGDAFIGLMQMTVMPYIMVSLLSNLGKIELAKQKPLIKAAAIVLVAFLVIGLGTVLVLPSFFPTWESSSFFSSSLVSKSEPIDFINIYIPSNLFGSLSNNVVPAVVLFSIIVGIALNTIPNNKKLIDALEIFGDALNKANKYIVKLTPIGIFGIAAHTAGSLSLGELGLIQVYMVIYTVAVIMLGFIFIPLLVSALTPFRYKDFIDIPRGSLVTIFATGKIIILLPQLIENVKQLFKKYGYEEDDIDSSAQLLMPLAYPFPNLGTLVIMVFVPFSAWFAGQELNFSDKTTFLASALLSSFVAPITGIPFLMDMLKIPNDIFQLFIVSTAFTDRVRVVLGAIHLFGLTVISIAYAKGLITVRWHKILQAFAFTIVFSFAILYPVKLLIGDSFQQSFDKYESFVSMDMEATRVKEITPDSSTNYIPRNISHIKNKGVIRVGFVTDALPYVFRNEAGEKVGFDVELMHIFAHELGLRIQWVEVKRKRVVQALNNGECDVFASGLPILTDALDKLDYSIPYTEMNIALLVADHDRDLYRTREQIIKAEDAVFASNHSKYLRVRIQEELPGIKFQDIRSPRKFLQGKSDANAMFFSAEAGSAWTLIYPSYSVVKPEGLNIKLPVSLAVAKNNLELERYLNKWLELKKYDGTMDRLYQSWILGEASIQKEKKWSIIRNVLHWVD
ncbi:MAG: cation:dicarboxylase symporter family transporter [Reichenbachiella sp.]